MDFSCAFLLFRLVRIGVVSESHVVFTFLLYNCLAFGLEFIIGLFFNSRTARLAAFFGEILLAVGLFLGMSVTNEFSCVMGVFDSSSIIDSFSTSKTVISERLSTLAFALVGVGNAFFHVGGGVDTLTRSNGRNWLSGVFISTGALGLALGIRYGDNLELGTTFVHVLSMTIVVAAALGVICRRTDSDLEIDGERNRQVTLSNGTVDKNSFWGLIAVLFVIFSRSVVGFVAPEIWIVRDLPEFPGITLAVAAFLGKFFGGFCADFSNPRFCAVFATIVSIPLLYLTTSPSLFWIGILLLNSTTALTLTTAAKICGSLVGFAFGLTTLALLGGFWVYNSATYLLERHDCLTLIRGTSITLMIFSGLALALSIRKTE